MKKNIILLLLTVALAATAVLTVSCRRRKTAALAAGAAPSVSLKAHNNLVGAKRSPHKTLSPEQVALKNGVAFVLHDWVAYSETLPLEEAEKWKNKKVSPGQMKTREHSLKANHKYTVISSKKTKAECVVIVEERIQTSINRYKLTLQKTAAGWVVVKFETVKLDKFSKQLPDG